MGEPCSMPLEAEEGVEPPYHRRDPRPAAMLTLLKQASLLTVRPEFRRCRS
jgi:hypothetical protein